MALLEGVQILLVLTALISQYVMVRCMAGRAGEKAGFTFIFFFNLYRIFEYAEHTRKETGKTGLWFRLFVSSLLLLVATIVFDVYHF